MDSASCVIMMLYFILKCSVLVSMLCAHSTRKSGVRKIHTPKIQIWNDLESVEFTFKLFIYYYILVSFLLTF